MSATIDVEIADGIATITLESPKTRNALNPKSSRRLVEVCDEVDANPDVGAVIMRGGGGLELERGFQMWSLRRRATRGT